MNAKIWAPTNSNLQLHHAFTDGRARCNRRITPHEQIRLWGADYSTREYVEKTACYSLCERCEAKINAEQAAAEETAVDHQDNAPTIAERANVTPAMVGAGRRPHYTANGAETLCRRDLNDTPRSAQAAALLDLGTKACALCDRAAQELAYTRRLAAASPLAAAAVDLAETVEQADADRAERRQQLADSRGANAYPLAVAAVRQFVRELPQAGALRVPVVEGSPEATLTRDDLHALAYSGHTTADAVARVRAAVAAHIRHGEREVHVMFPAHGMRPALYLADVMALLHRWDDNQAEAAKFERAARALDAVEHAEQVGARVETVEDAEALYATRVVTEAEAAAGTWRGEWIGEQLADDALFTVECPAEQGALFDDRATQ
jgi:hypothetical protein